MRFFQSSRPALLNRVNLLSWNAPSTLTCVNAILLRCVYTTVQWCRHRVFAMSLLISNPVSRDRKLVGEQACRRSRECQVRRPVRFVRRCVAAEATRKSADDGWPRNGRPEYQDAGAGDEILAEVHCLRHDMRFPGTMIDRADSIWWVSHI